MSDIINLLPDAIANQIAAGEVIQRPASVVKELIENSIDAGAHKIQLIVKDAGRTLIQVIDDGEGMSETDARMAFERHATSKIRNVNDLFSLHTMGFRGEALASIAAVAQVELKTARQEDETGTLLRITGSQVETQESIACIKGSIFSVRNLFFNVPARRKFLKPNETEFRNIITEFERIVLVNPQVAFTLYNNDVEVMNLPVANLKQRILNVSGKKLNSQLITVNAETPFMKVGGFIGTPDSSRKRGCLQFLFANNRYMRHPYFHKAVVNAFEPFITAGDSPNYFIYLTVDTSSIDVNIHPTKTEIKFENEQAIWVTISAAVKEAIGKSKSVPSLDFNSEDAIEMPVYNSRQTEAPIPEIKLNSGYNPFREQPSYHSRHSASDWEKLYRNISPAEIDTVEMQPAIQSEEKKEILSYRGKYLITSLKSGLCIIEQRRAHIRILFDDYMQRIIQKQGISQGILFPEIINFTPKEATVLPVLLDELAYIGFDLSDLGNNSFSINGIPSGMEGIDPVETLRNMLEKVIETGCEVKEEIYEALALALAHKAAIPSGKILSEDEAASLTARLFSSSSPNYTPDGKSIVYILPDDDLDKKFK
ncbi:MAG: DNA mismatch repair endonuclease MutL [Dysgonamonadaceae bacterium]|jgi:DNA mismatch repair protein MutL|nr:DNA mismatch repair endonuclease MutL [Dysgonamonadaceae bacterium]